MNLCALHLKSNRNVDSELAEYAGCEVKEVVVPIPQPASSEQFHWPLCTVARRCSGCCYSRELACLPVQTETKIVPVCLNVKITWYAAVSDSKSTTESISNIVININWDACCMTTVIKYSGIFGNNLFELVISFENYGAKEIGIIVVGLVIIIVVICPEHVCW